MITRRNWLLRCSVFVNVALILYGFMVHTNAPNWGTANGSSGAGGSGGASMEAAAAAGGGGHLKPQAADNGQRDLLQDFEASDNQQQQQQHQRAMLDDSDAYAAAMVAEQQQLQQQQQQQHLDGVAMDAEESRFEVPADSEHPDVAAVVAGGAGAAAALAAADAAHDHEHDGDTNANADAKEPDTDTLARVGHAVAAGESDTETRLQQLLECHNKEYISETVQRGDFWVLKNYIGAEHGELRCFETITYTTHADYTFLDNLIPLLRRWQAPISIAMHAPGTDFAPTIRAIRYLRDCAPDGELVRRFATFHMYFSSKHIPKQVPRTGKALDQLAAQPFNCTLPPAYANVTAAQLYKTQKKLLYPVNVGRNVARDAAQTHFILASDIELYPNPGLPQKFLDMVARNDAALQHRAPKVWPLSIFEVDAASLVPRDKTELLVLLKSGKAIPFHKRVCASCHGVPKSKEWMATNETEELGIFHIGKRVGYFVHWEPIYIGTHADPHYDERLSWEGKSDKMTQGYALCALDYEFQILDNAFLVHKPGIKVLKKDTKRAMLAAKTNQLIRKIIYPELQVMYGTRKGCTV